jgi:hypothetical protein
VRLDRGSPESPYVHLLDDVRNLQIIYSRFRPGEGTCFVEHVGGRVEVYQVDRFLLEHLEQHEG